MKIKTTCKECGNETTRELKVGDILTPTDGSGMPNKLHELLWNGHSCSGFKPVKVVAISGYMIAVIPASWQDRDIRRSDIFDNKIKAWDSLQSIWAKVDYKTSFKHDEMYFDLVNEHGYWINFYIAYPKEAVL